jgi:anti-sigma B factor antagonist
MASVNPSVTVIYPADMLNAESASKFQQQLVSAIGKGCPDELVVDMSKVKSLNNDGLVSFMSALNSARSRNKRLSICSAPPAVRIVFELTQLDRIFTMVDQSPAAIAA